MKKLLLLSFLSVFLLMGCGQTGALYLPQAKPVTKTRQHTNNQKKIHKQ